MKLPSAILDELVGIVGERNVMIEPSSLEEYKRDMADYEGTPIVVVRPNTEIEIVKIVELANKIGIPIVPRGAGSSLTGASVLDGAMVLDMRSMNRILKIDTVNWYVQVQPGISLDDLNQELKKRGFFFPPDPSSSYICTVGGAIAEGCGGLKCLRYGTMKDWVIAVRIVLPNGEMVRFGEPLSKNRAGYDLVHLMIGSEGTLGIIIEAYLKIIPLPTTLIRRMLVSFDDWNSVSKVIEEIRKSKIMPNLLEFLDKDHIVALNQKLQLNLEEAEAMLLIDVEEPKLQEAISIINTCGAKKIIVARDEEEAEKLYQVRAMAYLAIKNLASGIHVEDVTVPIDRLGEYFQIVKNVATRYKLKIPVNGHAGDGNVHPIILYNKDDPSSKANSIKAFDEICRYAINVGGSITGEHGVGVQKVQLLREQLLAHEGKEALRLMKEIKRLFDPKGIMNPGKYVEAT
jgi:glycolate oxidase subunit GlcD